MPGTLLSFGCIGCYLVLLYLVGYQEFSSSEREVASWPYRHFVSKTPLAAWDRRHYCVNGTQGLELPLVRRVADRGHQYWVTMKPDRISNLADLSKRGMIGTTADVSTEKRFET